MYFGLEKDRYLGLEKDRYLGLEQYVYLGLERVRYLILELGLFRSGTRYVLRTKTSHYLGLELDMPLELKQDTINGWN